MCAITYVMRCLFLALIVLASAAVLSVAVNPYDIYEVPRFDGLNSKKPKVLNHIVLAKQRQAGRIRPRTILLGNSRVYIGFDPASEIWPETVRPVYNFAIPGDDLSEVLRNLESAPERSKVRSAVVGLDFMDFLFPRACKLPPEPERESIRWRAETLLQTTLSLQSLKDSIRTLSAQTDDHAANLTAAGFGPLNEFTDLANWGGHGTLFWRKNLEYFGISVN